MPSTLHFRVAGLDCAEEVRVLRQALVPLVTSESRLSFDVLQGRMAVDVTGLSVDETAIIAAIATTGMTAESWTDRTANEEGSRKDARAVAWQRSLRFTVASGMFLALGLAIRAAMVWNGADGAGWQTIAEAVEAIAMALGLWLVLPKAWRAAIQTRPDMNLLMTVAVLGAVVLREFQEAASVSFLFALSGTLETWSIRRAHRAIVAMMDLAPPMACRMEPDGTEVVCPVADVRPGSRIVVKPGERIPLDGTVVAGSSDVNQAAITGESLPIPKQLGEFVFAGSVNGQGALEVQTTRAAEETTVAHIVRMIDEAQARRGPSEQWVERFARVYTPAVMALALLTFLTPVVLFQQPAMVWFYRSLVLLVIACPCALVISTPVSVVSALASAARHGVLVRGGAPLDAVGRLRAIAFDKTGTLTEGRPQVRRVLPLNGHTEREFLERLTALELRGKHPFAQAIVAYAESQGVSAKPARDFVELPGKGAVGSIDEQQYWLGSQRMLEERGLGSAELHQTVREWASQGQGIVVAGNGHEVCGLVALTDTIRPAAASTIVELRRLGISHITMLTGDTRPAAAAIAQSLQLDEVSGELLPEEKVSAVEGLAQRFGTVAMVGDGVNDAPALARAPVGIAMNAAGSDVAIETADVALMSADLAKIPWVVRLARRAVGTIRQNIFFALSIKVAFFALTLAGISSLWGAIAADMGASLLVIFNGLRLLRAR